MASNRFKLFENDNGSMRLNPLGLAFVAFQIVLFVTIIIIAVWFNNDKQPDDDITRYERVPELSIKDLSQKAPSLSELEIKDIQKSLFTTVSSNTPTLNVSKIEATIRDGETHENTFNGKSTYLNMIIDIPSLEQSYNLIYSSNAVIDPEISTYVLCLDNDAQIIYKNFDCKSSSDKSIKQKIVSTYLGYFRYDYFSVYIDPDDPNTVVIGPSITYENSAETKAAYIDEVKKSIESLGISSDTYKYYVRTARDIDYKN